MVNLFTIYYNETNAQRNKELLFCIKNNLENKQIDRVFILNQKGPLTDYKNNPKLKICEINHRPTFQSIFEYANSQSSDNDLNIISNTDIIFDKSIDILGSILSSKKCFALTRWDVLENGNTKLFHKFDSQDTWIFKGKIKPMNADFFMGIPRCDARLAYEIKAAGYNIKNPCFSIKTYHYHQTNYRTYEQHKERKLVSPPYLSVPHKNLNNFLVNSYNYFFNKKKYFNYTWHIKNDWRKYNENFYTKKNYVFKCMSSFIKRIIPSKFLNYLLSVKNKNRPINVENIDNELSNYINSLTTNPTFVHIGAFDGTTNDPMYKYVKTDWNGIVVEGEKSAYRKLVTTYEKFNNIQAINAVINETTDEIKFYHFNYHHHYNALSTTNYQTIFNYQHEQHPDIQKDMSVSNVKAIGVKNLVTQYSLQRINILRLSTGGTEYSLLKLFFSLKILPDILVIDNKLLRDNYDNFYKLLKRNNYKSFKDSYNTLCIHNTL